jgi:hypothetical protein
MALPVVAGSDDFFLGEHRLVGAALEAVAKLFEFAQFVLVERRANRVRTHSAVRTGLRPRFASDNGSLHI